MRHTTSPAELQAHLETDPAAMAAARAFVGMLDRRTADHDRRRQPRPDSLGRRVADAFVAMLDR